MLPFVSSLRMKAARPTFEVAEASFQRPTRLSMGSWVSTEVTTCWPLTMETLMLWGSGSAVWKAASLGFLSRFRGG